ncbi:MAG TPA: NAD(P)H-dependent oxidoreductase [Bacteroidia bacterium]|nr:NAD(P)H-dependent oxidoreductase [Bacteroidia bacterium]
MYHIEIISSSVRKGRNSHRVAQYLQYKINSGTVAKAVILDLMEYNFPIFDERLKYQASPTPQMLEYAARIKNADGIIIVTPEYNGGYPPALKNAVDFLYEEWRRKPVAISTVSDGSFGGTQVITSIQFTLWKMKALTVPAMFPNPKVQDVYDEKGVAKNPAETDKRSMPFIEELYYWIKAANKMKEQSAV